MPESRIGDITQLLRDWSDGRDGARERLMTLVYEQLRLLAGGCLRSRRPGTLQPTAVVHEAYLRLLDQRRVRWQDRSHFFAIAARMMRRVIIDHVRRRNYLKRGGGQRRVSLNDDMVESSARAPDWIGLDDALTSLAALDPLKASVVELRFYGGLSLEQTASAVGRSRATVVREWRMAKAWLYRQLARGADGT